MYRSSPARKYGPLALLAAVQLVVVLVAPSTAPDGEDALATGLPGVAGGALAPGTALADGSTVAADGSIVAADGTVLAPAGTATTGTSGGTGVTTGSTAPGTSTGAAPKAAAVTGDTSHCVQSRQFDPKIEFYAPPCAPGKPGATGVDNGGATSFGVTKDAVKVVHYIPDYGAEVNAILRAQGLYYDAGNARIANAGFQSFINSRYQLHGRKLAITTYQGTCRTVPPDLQCLKAEMNRIVKEFQPYAVFFSTTVCSECYAELARLKVVSFGGSGFSEEFRNALRPYNYDYGMSSTRMSLAFAEWWCGSLAKKNAIYAGDQNPSQDFRSRKRQLGVISTDDPDNKRVIQKVLYPALAKCGESVNGHEYFYEQNVSTAAQQSQAGTAVMNSPENPATSVVCFCDPVAPQFSYNAAKRNNYWPEALIASNQSLDTDATGQTYMGDFACPPPGEDCSFDGALGLGQSDRARPPGELGGMKAYAAGSKEGVPLAPLVMEIFWQNYNMFASLVQATGPNLTPANMAASAPKLGARGGGDTGKALRVFADGEQSWTRDVYVLYWNKNKTSPFNGEQGGFVQAYGGKRFGLGQLPKGDPAAAIPTADKRQ